LEGGIEKLGEFPGFVPFSMKQVPWLLGEGKISSGVVVEKHEKNDIVTLGQSQQ
jgi:hypothetical protein